MPAPGTGKAGLSGFLLHNTRARDKKKIQTAGLVIYASKTAIVDCDLDCNLSNPDCNPDYQASREAFSAPVYTSISNFHRAFFFDAMRWYCQLHITRGYEEGGRLRVASEEIKPRVPMFKFLEWPFISCAREY